MANGRTHVVGRKEGVNRRKIGTCAVDQPTDATHNALISLLPAKKGWGSILWVVTSNGVDGMPRAIRSHDGGGETILELERLNQVAGKARLIEVN